MTIQSALKKLRRRNLNFSTLKCALNHYGLPSSNGWVNLERKYGELNVPAMTASNYASTLEKVYRNNVEWGDKAIQIANFDVSASKMLQEAVVHSYLPELRPHPPFPNYLSEEDVHKLALRPTFVAAEINSSRTGVTLFFYTRGYETLKETFSVDDMKDDASIERFAGFDQVVAYRQIIFQRIDSVYIDARGRRIEFRIDSTRKSTFDRTVEALVELKECFRTLMANQVNANWEKVTLHLANFFPKIDELYNDGHGELVELGHNTAAGAINHGKMRGHRGDLRQDPSHIASMTASTTEKFAIQKAYRYYNDVSVVHLRIPGKSADTGAAVPTINTAFIENCIDGKQFDDMMQLLR